MARPRLLADDEPPPVAILRPDGRSDFVLTADHAGRIIPRSLDRLGLPDDELARHIAWDIGIDGVTRRLSEALDATAVFQRYSRLVIDCNRPHGVSSSIPVISELTEIPGNLSLAVEACVERQRLIMEPYQVAIGAALDARDRAGRRSVLIAMHSFTPVYKGERRTIEVGVLYHRDSRLARALLDVLDEEPGLAVGDNDPYEVSDATDYTIPVHGERRGIPHVEIEIRQDLIATPEGERDWAARFARWLPAADARLRAAIR